MEGVVLVRFRIVLGMEGLLVDPHHVGEGLVEEGVVHALDFLKGEGKGLGGFFVEIIERGQLILLGKDVDPIGPIRIEGEEDDEVVILEDDPLAELDFLIPELGEEALAVFLKVGLRLVQLQADPEGEEAEGVDLAMGVDLGGTDLLAPVLEGQDVLDLGVGREVPEAVNPEVHQFHEVVHGKIVEGSLMVRGIKNNLALTIGGGRLEKLVSHRVGFSRLGGHGGPVIVVLEDPVVVGDLAGTRTEGTVVLGAIRSFLSVSVNDSPVV